MSDLLLIILACAAVNYLLRVVPFIIPIGDKLPPYVKRFLDYMPVAALGALILPGIITSFPDNPAAGIAGIAAAGLTSWLTGGLILPVFASIGTAWIVLQYFPI
ncbi:MAG TPA: AzlD domain-containing protein [Spirochaetota bacterium]|nr:AzlD domain-containing protein [Spirochaetota bacterium]